MTSDPQDASGTIQPPTGGGSVVAEAEEEARIDAALGAARTDVADAFDATGAPRTRELLAEVASRAEHDQPSELRARRDRSYVRWLLLLTVGACGLLLAVLWWLDPISVTGRQTRFSVVENGGVRQAKLDLMEELEQAPDVLMLGSPRSMKLDPATVERVAGVTAFNGGVSGGTTRDMYLYARYADELWDGEGEFPHLVIGVVHDVFRYTGTAAQDPRLKRFLPRDEQQRDPLAVSKELLQLTTVKAAARSVRRVTARDGYGALLRPEQGTDEVDASLATTGRQRSNQRENLSPRGMQLFDPVPDMTVPLAERIERQMSTFVQRSYEADPGFTGMDARGLDMLVRTIRLANRRGDVPTLWVTPFAPGAARYLPADEYSKRDAAFRRTIKQLLADSTLELRFADYGDIAAFGGSPAEFHDGIHMTKANADRVLEQLHEDGLLTRPARRG